MHVWIYGWDCGWLVVLLAWAFALAAVSYLAVDLMDPHHRHHPR